MSSDEHSEASPFDLDWIRREAPIAELEYRSEIDSTSTLALELVRQQQGLFPLLVLAHRQTAGRGRGSNRWWSQDGALTFSLVLDGTPLAQAERWPLVPLVVGWGVCDAVEQLFPQLSLKLKWPNDVYLDDRKLAGILIERQGQEQPRIIVGIGLNVNNSLLDAPEELQRSAVSLIDELAAPGDASYLLVAILQAINDLWQQLVAGSSTITDHWAQRCWLTGHTIHVQQTNDTYAGRCAGIDRTGRLLVDGPTGRRAFVSGTVRRT